jgi:hypothetical protein
MIPAKAASKVLLKAAERLGGVEKLAAHLGMTAQVLKRQIEGTYPVSEVEYLQAVDVVLGELPTASTTGSSPSRPDR